MTDLRPRRAAVPLLLGLFAALAGCQPRGAESRPAAGAEPVEPAALAASAGLSVHHGDGFSIRHPSAARIEPLEGLHGARSGVRVLGPELSIRPTDREFSWHGAAYDLAIRTFDNPERLDAGTWAARFVERSEARVDERGPAEVAGYPAYRFTTFGGDSQWVTLVVARGDRAHTLTYNDTPEANFPAAAAARDIHALLLGGIRLVDP